MKPWELTSKKLKNYPHFDEKISLKNANILINNPDSVASHAFFPFLTYLDTFTPYRLKDKEKKERPIRYACRADSYIYSHYRNLLSNLYERELATKGISDSVLAYRHVPKQTGSMTGKCNIDFAKDVFDKVNEAGNCLVITADISSYFESIDHNKLKQIWADLLGMERLPKDHFAVFKNVTNYSDVNKQELYRCLGYIEEIETIHGQREIYTKRKNEIPTKLCSGKEFREKVEARGNKKNSLINKNKKSFGIPQGSPISDVLANMYLMSFDQIVSDYAKNAGGYYCRYSDDLLLIIPTKSSEDASKHSDFLSEEIKKSGEQLEIKKSKCASLLFTRTDTSLEFESLDGQMKNGLEYLGFRYDGKNVYLRDKTLSRFYRKLKRSASAHAYKWVSRYPGKSQQELISSFNYDSFYQKFGKVENFNELSESNNEDTFKRWTFFSYAKKACITFETQGRPILKQTKNYKKKSKKHIEEKIIKALAVRET